MGKLTLTGAFAHYGATAVNINWACSAIASDGSVVFSGWNHTLAPQPDGRLLYRLKLSAWDNKRGANLLRKHMGLAYREGLPIRFILATSSDPAKVEAGEARSIPKTFSLPNLVGHVLNFDGDNIVIEFEEVK